MASKLQVPGVYIEEKHAFPNSAIALETAVPVFIGYTEKAERAGRSLLKCPVKISSLDEYHQFFGGAFHTKFKVADPQPGSGEDMLLLNGVNKIVKPNDYHTLYFYNAIRLFYLNGGNNAYIVSVGQYGGDNKEKGIEIKAEDFVGEQELDDVFKILEKETEPTLIVMPDIIHRPSVAMKLYKKMLKHCCDTRSRFAILDVAHTGAADPMEDVTAFRKEIGTNCLSYGAAYYPWLKTTLVQFSELDFTCLDASVDLTALLPEADAQTILKEMKASSPEKLMASTVIYHHALLGASPTYVVILEAIRSSLNLMPPSAAIAGIFALVDNTRGVWKSPSNISLSRVYAAAVSLSAEQQEAMNIDLIEGKSINVIRNFPDLGILVWGARTLDGNSTDWRYINIKRTMMMIEQSLKLAIRAYVFEPNNAETWKTIATVVKNFLHNLWKQGAIAGTDPENAYSVHVGLGETMTPDDILDDKMRITIKVALLRPAEYVMFTFQQQMQTA